MPILGLIVEYNPFHLGHQHHLDAAKRLTRPEATIAVMSGCFTQRGEPAITDKWSRAQMALRQGIDLVVELPVAWAVRSAPYFAEGATRLLAELGATDVCFGSESGDLRTLDQVARLLLQEPQTFKQELKAGLDQGLSFAAAQDRALQRAAPELPAGVFASPNNTLGIHYLMSIQQHGLALQAHTIPRTTSYNDAMPQAALPSAKAVRLQLLQGEDPTGLPPAAASTLKQSIATGRAPISWEDFSLPMLYRLRQLSPEQLELYPETGEGLGIRLHQAARQTNRLQELWKLAKTRRFTFTRLQRLLTYVLLDIRQHDLQQIQDWLPPPYIRVLAMNTAKQAVRSLLAKAKLPVIFSAGRSDLSQPRANRCLQLDIAASDCYTLAFRQDSRSGLDYTVPVITEKSLR
ncbi:MAG: nucleotidyltransferase family protein [Bacillota bacterium]